MLYDEVTSIYPKENPMSASIIVGFSIYVNGYHWQTHESLHSAQQEANRYRPSNEVDVLPMWGVRHAG